jgi:hypothetical protein
MTTKRRFQPMSDAVRTRVAQSVPDPDDDSDLAAVTQIAHPEAGVADETSETREVGPGLDRDDVEPARLAESEPDAQIDPAPDARGPESPDGEQAAVQDDDAPSIARASGPTSANVEVIPARPALPLRRATRSRNSIERQRNVSIKIDGSLRSRVDTLAHHALETTGFSLNRSRLVADAIAALPDDVERIAELLDGIPAVIDMGHTVMLVGTIPEPLYRRLATLALSIRQITDRSDATNALAYLAVEQHIDRLLG